MDLRDLEAGRPVALAGVRHSWLQRRRVVLVVAALLFVTVITMSSTEPAIVRRLPGFRSVAPEKEQLTPSQEEYAKTDVAIPPAASKMGGTTIDENPEVQWNVAKLEDSSSNTPVFNDDAEKREESESLSNTNDIEGWDEGIPEEPQIQSPPGDEMAAASRVDVTSEEPEEPDASVEAQGVSIQDHQLPREHVLGNADELPDVTPATGSDHADVPTGPATSDDGPSDEQGPSVSLEQNSQDKNNDVEDAGADASTGGRAINGQGDRDSAFRGRKERENARKITREDGSPRSSVAQDEKGSERAEMEEAREPEIPSVESSAAEEQAMRRDAVRNAMKFAWDKYTEHAWGYDELKPQTKTGADFIGLGATIVDSLSTLHIMGMTEEFDSASEWVHSSMNLDKSSYVSVFETTIRVLGGLISAWELSGEQRLLDKAAEVADRLLPAFATESGLPLSNIRLDSGATKQHAWVGTDVLLAEFGTLSMEWTALAEHTGEEKYRNVIEQIQKNVRAWEPKKDPPIFPLYANPETGHFSSNTISFGAMGDSFFEYLIKEYIRSGQKHRWLLELYEQQISAMFAFLWQKSDKSQLAYVSEWANGNLLHKMDHLACFTAGMLALGSRYVSSQHAAQHLDAAEALGETCFRLYEEQPTGLSPDSVTFPSGKDVDFVPASKAYIHRPETVESLFILWRITKNPKYQERGWQIFQAIEKHCRTAEGYAGVVDVTNPESEHDNHQQSFLLAETFKYLYLLFSPDNVLPLDDYVFNTEAHPLRIASG